MTPAVHLHTITPDAGWHARQRALLAGCGRWVLLWQRLARIALGNSPAA